MARGQLDLCAMGALPRGRLGRLSILEDVLLEQDRGPSPRHQLVDDHVGGRHRMAVFQSNLTIACLVHDPVQLAGSGAGMDLELHACGRLRADACRHLRLDPFEDILGTSQSVALGRTRDHSGNSFGPHRCPLGQGASEFHLFPILMP